MLRENVSTVLYPLRHFQGNGMFHEEHGLLMPLKAIVRYVQYVTFIGMLCLACNTFPSIRHAVLSNPFSSFWCHLQ